MLAILLLLLAFRSTAFGLPLTGQELINPSQDEISRCAPETMREPINEAIANLPKVAKVTAKLYKVVKGNFAKNCKLLAKYLGELDREELLSYENIAPKFKDRKVIHTILNDEDTGFDNYLSILSNLDFHIVGYVGILHGFINQNNKLTIIDLIHLVDLIQRSALELQEIFQMLSYLSLAFEEIKGFQAILHGMNHQLSFKIIYIINSLCALTEDLRVSYLSLLDKGDCSHEHITNALGIKSKKIEAIKDE